MSEGFKRRDVPTSSEVVNEGRRRFLRGAGALVATTLIPAADTEMENVQQPPETREKMPSLSPLEQLIQQGRITDLKSGLGVLYGEQVKFLSEVPSGMQDMKTAVENIRKIGMDVLTKPFKDVGFPPQLGFMIAIQETRGKSVILSSGARGVMGIMPQTAKDHKHKPEDMNDPEKAAGVSARLLASERVRFGNDLEVLLTAYNAGGGLHGFTKVTKKEERTLDNFYAFMQKRMNERYARVSEAGYYEYTIRRPQKPEVLKRVFGLDDEAIKLLPTQLIHGVMMVPKNTLVRGTFDSSSEKTIKFLFRAEFEMIQYVPQMKAKYEALRRLGLLQILEAYPGMSTPLFGAEM
jgi:hypothetical protein